MIEQKSIILPARKRGYHLITRAIEEQLGALPNKGMVNLFIQHTSAALSLNENADPTVRHDFEGMMNKVIPDGDSVFTHTLEGSDDMPAHIKSSLFGASLSIPIHNHKLALGTWQGIYLCEFRDYGGPRKIMTTIMGE